MTKDTDVEMKDVENNQQGYIGNVPEEIFTKEILEKLSVREQWKLRLVAKRYKEIVDKKYPLIIKVNNVSKLEEISQAFKDTQYYIKLDLSALGGDLTDEGLLNIIAPYADKIISLNLYGCNKITDTGLEYIAANCKKLTELNLNQCYQITDIGLGYIAANCKELTVLSLNQCNQITDTGLGYIAANCKELTVLDLSGCNQIKDIGLGYIAKLTQLIKLNLNRCHQITDTGLGYIAKLTKLTALNLNRCDQITDTGIKDIVTNCQQLIKLKLARCDKIKDVWLEHIAANCKKLTVLNLNWCKKITDQGLGHIAKLIQLTELNLYGCDQISKEAKLNLIASLPNLNLKQCLGFEDLSEKEIAEARRSKETDTHCATEVNRRNTSNDGPELQKNNN